MLSVSFSGAAATGGPGLVKLQADRKRARTASAVIFTKGRKSNTSPRFCSACRGGAHSVRLTERRRPGGWSAGLQQADAQRSIGGRPEAGVPAAADGGAPCVQRTRLF